MVASGVAWNWNLLATPPGPSVLYQSPPALVSPSVLQTPAINLFTTSGKSVPFALQEPRVVIPDQPQRDDLTAVFAALSMPDWEATVEPGDTLDGLLSRSEIAPQLRAEISLAFAAEYDLRRLRPGHSLSVAYQRDGTPARVELAVDGGVRVEVMLDDTPTSRTIIPTASTKDLAGEVRVDGSIYASLQTSGIPTRFAVDLAQILGDTVDFRRDLKGGENLNILWVQAVLADGSEIGQPRMSYAALDLEEDRFEIVWSGENEVRATVYLNGDILRTVAPPVEGARLSSVFGQRKHPVYGSVRMHTGVDYAAPSGTPISATAPGRVSFIGWRGGYGRVVEITHGSETMTRYAHLSDVAGGLSVGDRVLAGEKIGKVGQTGTATGPNLHYEVRIDGRPINPLGEELLAATDRINIAEATALLEQTRTRFATVVRDDT